MSFLHFIKVIFIHPPSTLYSLDTDRVAKEATKET